MSATEMILTCDSGIPSVSNGRAGSPSLRAYLTALSRLLNRLGFQRGAMGPKLVRSRAIL